MIGASEAETDERPERSRLSQFVRGNGRYVADVKASRVLHAAFARSAVPHGYIRSLDISAALAVPGVTRVLTGPDVAHLDSIPSVYDRPGHNHSRLLPLAQDRVLYVGHAVAVVVASSRSAAARGCRAIRAVIEPVPAIADIDAALAPGAPRLFDQWPDNVIGRSKFVEGDVAAEFANAALVIDGVFESPRCHPLPLETRGLLAEPGPEPDSVVLHTSAQSVHELRRQIAAALRWPEHRLRVLCGDVGGAFGLKIWAYPEDPLIVLLAHELQRPVRWIESRRESFLTSSHGRGQRVRLTAGFDADGRMRGMYATIELDKGADSGPVAMGTALFAAACLPGLYAVPAVDITAIGIVTNRTPTGAYRGYGQPEVNFAVERIMDQAADRLGIDPLQIRSINMVPADKLPCASATGVILDSGDFHALLAQLAEQFGFAKARRDAAAQRANGRLVGVGISTYADLTNLGPASGLSRRFLTSGGFDTATVRMDRDGHVLVYSGQMPMGQGVELALAEVCARELKIPVDHVRVAYGDSNLPYSSFGTGASRGAGVGGSSVLLASRVLSERLKRWGSHLLQVSAEAVELWGGCVRVAADAARSVPISHIASLAYIGADRPDGVEPGLQETVAYDPPGQAASYGMVAAQVEVDRASGSVRLTRLMLAHDCGTQLNPQIVHGQIVGGAAQGVGSALFEEMQYDGHGFPLTSSLHDYCIPLAGDLPDIEIVHASIPAAYSANGAKGAGESGVIGVPAAIANAVQDALGAHAVIDRLPLTCEKILGMLREREPAFEKNSSFPQPTEGK